MKRAGQLPPQKRRAPCVGVWLAAALLAVVPLAFILPTKVFTVLRGTGGAAAVGASAPFSQKQTFLQEQIHLLFLFDEIKDPANDWQMAAFLCAVESHARQSLGAKVVVHAHSKDVFWKTYAGPLANASFPLFEVVEDLETVADDTPVEALIRSAAWAGSSWPQTSRSNILRVTILYKFGGYYSDLDTILIRPPSSLPPSSLFAQVPCPSKFCEDKPDSINSSPLRFRKPRSPFLEVVMNEIARTYKPDHAWGIFGPVLWTRMWLEHCNKEDWDQMADFCQEISILPTSFGSPMLWWEVDGHTRVPYLQDDWKAVLRSTSYHWWNSRAANVTEVPRGSLLSKAIERFCPVTFSAYEDTPAFGKSHDSPPV